jgi:hypothetical protein
VSEIVAATAPAVFFTFLLLQENNIKVQSTNER